MVKTLIILLILNSLCFAESWQMSKSGGWYKYERDNGTQNKEGLLIPVVPPREMLMSMPPKRFKALYDDVFDYATTVRTIDAFGVYETVRQAAADRAGEFANLQQLYNQLHPTTSIAEYRQFANEHLDNEIRDYLAKHKSEYGLIYFYSKTCAYCAKQAPLLSFWQAESGWEIEGVDIDAKPQLKARFGISSTPTILLLDRNRETYMVSNGFVPLDDLRERLYRYIRYIKGETKDINFGDMRE